MQIIIKNTNKYLDVTENKLYDVIGYINEFDFYQILDDTNNKNNINSKDCDLIYNENEFISLGEALKLENNVIVNCILSNVHTKFTIMNGQLYSNNNLATNLYSLKELSNGKYKAINIWKEVPISDTFDFYGNIKMQCDDKTIYGFNTLDMIGEIYEIYSYDIELAKQLVKYAKWFIETSIED